MKLSNWFVEIPEETPINEHSITKPVGATRFSHLTTPVHSIDSGRPLLLSQGGFSHICCEVKNVNSQTRPYLTIKS